MNIINSFETVVDLKGKSVLKIFSPIYVLMDKTEESPRLFYQVYHVVPVNIRNVLKWFKGLQIVSKPVKTYLKVF